MSFTSSSAFLYSVKLGRLSLLLQGEGEGDGEGEQLMADNSGASPPPFNYPGVNSNKKVPNMSSFGL